MEILTTEAIEEGTYVITVTFMEDGVVVTPDSFYWSLTNSAGAIINSRDEIEISTPGSSEDIYLSGDDLAMETITDQYEKRRLVIEGLYTPSGIATQYPYRREVEFPIRGIDKTLKDLS